MLMSSSICSDVQFLLVDVSPQARLHVQMYPTQPRTKRQTFSWQEDDFYCHVSSRLTSDLADSEASFVPCWPASLLQPSRYLLMCRCWVSCVNTVRPVIIKPAVESLYITHLSRSANIIICAFREWGVILSYVTDAPLFKGFEVTFWIQFCTVSVACVKWHISPTAYIR